VNWNGCGRKLSWPNPKVGSRHCTVETKKTLKWFQTGESMCRKGFEPDNSRIQVKKVTARGALLVICVKRMTQTNQEP
jgi:hypothetical protein